MGTLTIKCYRHPDECGYCLDGWCYQFNLPCGDIHIDECREDGEGDEP